MTEIYIDDIFFRIGVFHPCRGTTGCWYLHGVFSSAHIRFDGYIETVVNGLVRNLSKEVLYVFEIYITGDTLLTGTFAIICMMAGRSVQEVTSKSTTDGQALYTAIQVTTALSIVVGVWQVS